MPPFPALRERWIGSGGFALLRDFVSLLAIAGWVILGASRHVACAEGAIQTIVDDVHGASGEGPRSEPPRDDHPSGNRHSANSCASEPDDSGWWLQPAVNLSFYTVTSPIWLPIAVLEEDVEKPAYFPRFPYGGVGGHFAEGLSDAPGKPWSARLNVEYLEPFTDVNGVGGRFLLSTTSRLGFDTSLEHFEERRPSANLDRLWLGDANLVFRFAQADWAEFRAGIGLNWLDHPVGSSGHSDFGVNFTYGADFYPRKPWVFSVDLDGGTLGHAGLFRLNMTGGVMLRGLEVYTGYEYLDIGRTQLNMLLGGLRLSF